jgi:hypothetical protein
LRTGKPVDRGSPAGPSRSTLPGWLVEKLLGEVGLSEAELHGMTEEEARHRLHEHWSQPRQDE